MVSPLGSNTLIGLVAISHFFFKLSYWPLQPVSAINVDAFVLHVLGGIIELEIKIKLFSL